MTTGRVTPDLETIRRENAIFDLYSNWPTDDPDDDPLFVALSRQIMGGPPLPTELD